MNSVRMYSSINENLVGCGSCEMLLVSELLQRTGLVMKQVSGATRQIVNPA